MDNFLPDSYEMPVTPSNYMKLKDGINRFRILETPIVGWETWKDKEGGGRVPVRTPMNKPFSTVDIPDGDPNKIKHFWAMPVWNYQEEKIQILEITQKSIQKSIKSLSSDADWGSPLNYDIVVTKTGQKMETKYEVQPKPAKPLEDRIREEFDKSSIDLTALFRGEDPFTK